jgi:filamentous hemagglutinin
MPAAAASKTHAPAAAEALGFNKIGERSHGQAVVRNGNLYITRDVDSHNGGVWKMATSVAGPNPPISV